MLRRATHGEHLGKRVYDIVASDPAIGLHRQSSLSQLVDHRKELEVAIARRAIEVEVSALVVFR